ENPVPGGFPRTGIRLSSPGLIRASPSLLTSASKNLFKRHTYKESFYRLAHPTRRGSAVTDLAVRHDASKIDRSTRILRRSAMTTYQRALVNGHSIFYREAGAKDAPTVLLLHGFPTSSHMFRNLIPTLAQRYHVIAPDLPGFGFSDTPDRGTFR